MKHLKHVICLATGIMVLTAVSASANTAASANETSQASPGAVQTAQSTVALMSVVESVLQNATGANKLTVLAVPEPTTMALAGLGGAALLLFRRKRTQSK